MKEKMALIGVRLTRRLVSEIDELVREGLYPNRSEVIRDAARIMVSGREAMPERERVFRE